ncbi:MAG: twin-arginine translocation signal domain-containing protein [Polyangia bacterium]|jgi:hypothetical protein|nr:twin-arginine translocation signal domain-containing protein [Polyangia bacterium]
MPGYPTLVELVLPETSASSRRAFLRGAAVAGAAVAGTLLPSALRRGRGGGQAEAAPAKPELKRVNLTFQRRYVFRHGNYELQRAMAQTQDQSLAHFMADPKIVQGLETALRKELDSHSCADLLEGKRLSRLQTRLGTAIVDHYRKMSRRIAPAPTVVLFVGVPNDRCRGDCPAVTPVCRPPTP